jgi:hypothetical protein
MAEMQSSSHGPLEGEGADPLAQAAGDDWLDGATVEAHAQEVSLGELDVALEGLDEPQPTDPNVA